MKKGKERAITITSLFLLVIGFYFIGWHFMSIYVAIILGFVLGAITVKEKENIDDWTANYGLVDTIRGKREEIKNESRIRKKKNNRKSSKKSN